MHVRDMQKKREHHREYMKMRFHKDPVHRAKHLARVRLGQAKRRGIIIQLPCADCGSNDSQAHHEDYSKPLEVDWLCRDCHGRRHGGLQFGGGV